MEMRAFPIEARPAARRRSETIGRAIVVGDRDPVAFRHEGEAAHGRWRGKGLDARLWDRAAKTLLAARPGDGAVVPRGERIDPFAFFMRDLVNAAILGGRHHSAIIAPGDEFVARRRRRREWQHRDAPRCAVRPPGVGEQHGAVSERKRWSLRRESPPPSPARRRRAASTCRGQREAAAMVHSFRLHVAASLQRHAAQPRKPSRNLVFLQIAADEDDAAEAFFSAVSNRAGDRRREACARPGRRSACGSSLKARMPFARKIDAPSVCT